jgi:hypothetical protein
MWTDLVMGLVNAAPINLRRRLVRCIMMCFAKGQEDLNRCWPQKALPPYHLHMSAIKSIMLCCTVGVWYVTSWSSPLCCKNHTKSPPANWAFVPIPPLHRPLPASRYPAIYVVAAISIVTKYWQHRWGLFRQWMPPPQYGYDLIRQTHRYVE